MTTISLFESLDGLGFSGIQYFLSVLWQSSILFGAVWVLSYLLRRRQAAVRHLLWAGALLVVPFLPLLAEAVSQAGSPQVRVPVMPAYPAPRAERVVPEGPDLPAQDASATEELPAAPEETFSPTDYPWALGLMGYGAGLAVMLSLVALGRVRLWLWRRRSRAAGDPRLRRAFGSARRELGTGRRVSLRESDEVEAPLTVGLFRPAVLVPSGLGNALSNEDLKAVAFHELTHVRRLDAPVLGLISVVRAVLWFHPLVWLACRQVSELAETACDDAVLEADVEPVKYAGMLTRIAEGLPRRAVSLEIGANMVFSRSKFFRRIETILSDRRGRIKKLTKLALAGTVVAVVLSIGLAAALPISRAGDERSDNPNKTPAENVRGITYTSRGTIKRPVQFGPRTFNSEIPMDIVIQPFGSEARRRIGRTPLEEPVEIPECKYWYIGPRHTATGVDWEGIKREILRHDIPGLRVPDIPGYEFTDEELAQLQGLDDLQVLFLSGAVTDEGLAYLEGFRNLRNLSLVDTNITSDGLVHLKGLKNLRALVLLKTNVGNDGLAHLVGLKKLKRLYLWQTNVTDAGVAYLNEMPGLRVVWLPENITSKGILKLEGRQKLTGITLWGIKLSERAVRHLTQFKNLEKLDFGVAGITDEDLAHFKGLGHLRELTLSGNEVSDAGLTYLGGMRDLRWLDLSDTNITDEGLAAIAKLKKLEFLDLADTRIGGEGLKHVASLNNLEILWLHDTRIEDEDLEPLKKLRDLQRLYVMRTRVSQEGINKLKAAIPNLKVYR